MNKRVIYTAIFGGYDNLVEPSFVPDGWDFVCFTDLDIKSDVWDIKKVLPLCEDSTRNARRYKVLPHIFLSDYDYSIWVDGNINIRGDVNELIINYLYNCNIMMMDHNQNILDPRRCVYEESKIILELGKKNGNYKDNPDIIKKQMSKYELEGYPPNNELAVTMEVLRKHNEIDVIKLMTSWWEEIKYGSKRDQLSFNYCSWKTGVKFKWFHGDSRDNKYFLNMGKHQSKIKSEIKTEPISLEYFLNMEIAGGGPGKMLVRPNHINKIGEMVRHWKNSKQPPDKNSFKIKWGQEGTIRSYEEPETWQYYNCMIAGFKHDVESHHEIGWDKMTKEYYDSKKDMTAEELEVFLKQNPIQFDNGFIKHSYHRACAMVGRLIRGQKYIPFYMEKEKIYDKPRDHDNVHRIFPLINNVKSIKLPEKLFSIPPGEFTICQSGILALMGIRQNNDLDIIISSEARNQIFNGNEDFIRNGNLEIFEKNKGKFIHFDAQGDDDLIENYSFKVDGYNFLEPRFYFRRKRKDRQKDIEDWKGIKHFFDMESYRGYPFNNLSLERWGKKWV